MEWYQVVGYIVTPLFATVIGVFQLYLNARFRNVRNEMENIKEDIIGIRADMKDICEDTKEMKTNYISRFDETRDKLDVINVSINGVQVEIAKQTVAMEFLSENIKAKSR